MIRALANAEVVVVRVARRGNRWVTWHTQRRVREVREQTIGAAEPGAIVVTREAVAFVRVSVHFQAALLGRRELAADLVGQIQIEFAVVRMEAGILELISLQGIERALKGALGRAEHI